MAQRNMEFLTARAPDGGRLTVEVVFDDVLDAPVGLVATNTSALAGLLRLENGDALRHAKTIRIEPGHNGALDYDLQFRKVVTRDETTAERVFAWPWSTSFKFEVERLRAR